MWTKQISASSSSIWVKRKTDATAALAGTVWEASSVFTEGSTPTWDELTGEVNAHITPVTLTQPSIISRLFKSVADKSGNYDSLIAGNVGKSQKSNRDMRTRRSGWSLSGDMTAYSMFPNGFVQAFGKYSNKQAAAIFHSCVPTHPRMVLWATQSSAQNKHFENSHKSANSARDSLKVPRHSCINHAIIISAYSERRDRSASLWEIRGSPDCDKTQLIVMSFFFSSFFGRFPALTKQA